MFEKPGIKKGLEESGNQPHILSFLFYQRNVISLSSSALDAKRGLPGQKEKGTGEDYKLHEALTSQQATGKGTDGDEHKWEGSSQRTKVPP